MIKTLTTKQGAELFMKPVDRRLYPAYFKQIKNPMDLGKVTKMIGARPCSYATVQEFAAAVRLTFDNCIRVRAPTSAGFSRRPAHTIAVSQYNGATSEIGAYAGRLNSIFERLLADWVVSADIPLSALNDDQCQKCHREWEYRTSELMLCEGCDWACHCFCLKKPLSKVPEGDWFCHRYPSSPVRLLLWSLRTDAGAFASSCEKKSGEMAWVGQNVGVEEGGAK